VVKYCYVASVRRRARRLGAYGGEERGGGILCRHAHSLFYTVMTMGFKELSDGFFLPLEAQQQQHCYVRLYFGIF